MAVTLEQIVFDSADAQRLAEFYATVLDRVVDPDGSEYFATVGRTGPAPLHPVFMFIHVPEEKAGKNRLHVDLVSPDRRADVQRALAAGGTHVADLEEYGTAWTTLRDPEGNVFDIGAGLT